MTQATPETVYMDAVLTPNNSLSPRGYKLVTGLLRVAIAISALAMLNAIIGYVMGTGMSHALPIFGFFGLDMAALWLALRIVRRQSGISTRVQVTADALRIDHRDGSGRQKSAEIPTAFARVELDAPFGPSSYLRIEYGRTAYVIGRFLTVKERKSLAKALGDAIQRARKERFVVP